MTDSLKSGSSVLVHCMQGKSRWWCEHCGLSFSLRHNLKTHEKTHTRYRLADCLSSDVLIISTLWLRTDLLKCRYCSYETIQKSNLKLHEATHERAAEGGGRGRGRGGSRGARPQVRQNRREADTEDQEEA